MIIRQWDWPGSGCRGNRGDGSGKCGKSTRVELRLSGPTWHAAACPHENPFGTARCHARIVTDARGTPIDGKARANRGGTPNAIPAGYGPADLKAAYAIPAGSGAPVIAIVDAYGYAKAESDLAVYRSQYGLPSCTTANGCFKKVSQTGGTNYPRDNDRLGAGAGTRPRHGERGVPELQDRPCPGEVRVLLGPDGGCQLCQDDPRHPRDFEQLRRD